MIGSKRKVYQILQRISTRSPLPSLENFYAPIGLELGGGSPEEIAISIAAQVLCLRYSKGAEPLRISHDPKLLEVLEGKLTPTDAASER